VKNSINTDSGELPLLMRAASLFFKPFAEPTKGWILMFLSQGGPQVVDVLPLVTSCASSCADACSCSS
jgi:hypothetical protein